MNRWSLAFLALALFAVTGCTVHRTAPGETIHVESTTPDGYGVTGTWQTQWGANVAIVELRQEGVSVQGSYRTTGAPAGMVSGSMSGNVLVGQWVDHAGGSGGFQFVFDEALQSFQGTWGTGGSLDDGGSWNGQRWQGEAAVTAAP